LTWPLPVIGTFQCSVKDVCKLCIGQDALLALTLGRHHPLAGIVGDVASRRLLAPSEKHFDGDQRMIAFAWRDDVRELTLDLVGKDFSYLPTLEREVAVYEPL
jgi:hypothetical protein